MTRPHVPPSAPVAIAHDFLTQRGGAERVVLQLLRVFPHAPVHTSLYEPDGTYPEFADVDIRPLPTNRIGTLRRNHRVGLPLYSPTFAARRVDAALTLCSSSGWAHGIRTTGAKVVYCHTPARWLYQPEHYLGRTHHAARIAASTLKSPARAWDRRAAASADLYLANSTVTSERIRRHYGIDAKIVVPARGLEPDGPVRVVAGVSGDFVLCVARLLPYKNVDAVVDAIAGIDGVGLVVVGDGPQLARLERRWPAVRFLHAVDDDELRWLYRSCAGLVTAAYEDYGLTPPEAAAFAKPAAVLRWGGFLDTVVDDVSGVFFDEPEPDAIREGVVSMLSRHWDESKLLSHAETFSPEAFRARLLDALAGLLPTSVTHA